MNTQKFKKIKPFFIVAYRGMMGYAFTYLILEIKCKLKNKFVVNKK